MEGACGQIIATADPEVVIKKVYKRPGPHRRTKSHRAPTQCAIQCWAHGVCQPSNGYTVLFVPRAWDPMAHQYTMQRINTDQPITNEGIPEEELKKFYADAKTEGIFPCDYELYKQPDGRVAMIDFDKFGRWQENGIVVFPWGLTLNRAPLPFDEKN